MSLVSLVSQSWPKGWFVLSLYRLTTLHLYGCKRIRNTSDLRLLNPALTIEC